ncbi:MAG: hypothetical protein HY365_02330 [Candidatus Aenigmarchaeota archaeon]|nr:hypothetical protein [Candidatus Aenigmarchaeota archaeon]
MVLEFIVAAVLLAFGFMSVYFSIEQRLADRNLMLFLLGGILCMAIGGWIVLSKITVGFLLKKIAGILLTAVGAFLVIGFPDVTDYQKEGMTKLGIFIGLVLGFLGVWLLLS